MSELKSKKILLAFDGQENRNHFSDLLLETGACMFHARNSQDAFLFLKTQKVDLVITDTNMRGNTGLELLIQVKAIRPQLPVLICLTEPLVRQVQVVEDLLNLGANEVFDLQISSLDLVKICHRFFLNRDVQIKSSPSNPSLKLRPLISASNYYH